MRVRAKKFDDFLEIVSSRASMNPTCARRHRYASHHLCAQHVGHPGVLIQIQKTSGKPASNRSHGMTVSRRSHARALFRASARQRAFNSALRTRQRVLRNVRAMRLSSRCATSGEPHYPFAASASAIAWKAKAAENRLFSAAFAMSSIALIETHLDCASNRARTSRMYLRLSLAMNSAPGL